MNLWISPRFEKDFDHPIRLIDVGASGGIQSHWKPAARHLEVIGFEPDKEEFEKLQGSAPTGVRYFNTALADRPGAISYRLNKKQMTSSLFAPRMDVINRFPGADDYHCVKEVQLEADTLDNVFEQNGIIDSDFAKVDAQGAELAILRGGRQLLEKSLFGLEIEVEFLEIYQGQPLFSDVDEYVRSFGYELFDLRPFTWKRKGGTDLGGPFGQIAFGDALYFKTVASLDEILARLESQEEKRAKLLRAVVICILYGYLDYGLELMDSQKVLFSESERTSIYCEFQSQRRGANSLPDFRGRWRLAHVLHRMAEWLDPSNRGWSIGRDRLGNLK